MKSIEEIIKDEAFKYAKSLYQFAKDEDIKESTQYDAYIAGRSQNLAREKEYREALAELVRLKNIKDEMDELPDGDYTQYRIDKDKAWQKAKQLLNP